MADDTNEYETEHDKAVAETEERLARAGILDDFYKPSKAERDAEVARRRAERTADTPETEPAVDPAPYEFQRRSRESAEYHALPIWQRPGAFSLAEKVYQEEREAQRRRRAGPRLGGAKSWFN